MLLILSLVACDGAKLEGDATAGEALYTANCAVCHGADGAGTDAYPSLVDEVPGADDDEIEEIVLNGEEAMPAFDFDEQEMADMLAYLRATFG